MTFAHGCVAAAAALVAVAAVVIVVVSALLFMFLITRFAAYVRLFIITSLLCFALALLLNIYAKLLRCRCAF